MRRSELLKDRREMPEELRKRNNLYIWKESHSLI
jgi:hypothetical protein